MNVMPETVKMERLKSIDLMRLRLVLLKEYLRKHLMKVTRRIEEMETEYRSHTAESH